MTFRRTLLALCLGATAGWPSRAQQVRAEGLASVSIHVSSSGAALGFYRDLLGFPVALRIPGERGEAESVFLEVNDRQFIELIPDLKAGDDRRMAQVNFEARELPLKLVLLPLSTPPVLCRDGSRAIHFVSPSGTALSFVEYLPDSRETQVREGIDTARRISAHLWHAGIVVDRNDVARELGFYEGQLGLREFWRGGPEGAPTAWINLSIGGERGDYIELMLSEPHPDRKRLGSMQHICLQVPDIQASLRTIRLRDSTHSQAGEPKIGRNGKWQLNLFDPDGTRVELMEPERAR